MNECSNSSCSACGSWWRLPLMLALVLAAVYLARNIGPRETTPSTVERSVGPAGTETTGSVSAVIDFGDSRRREFDAIAWREGMTVGDLLWAAGDAPGGLKFSQQGSNETAFLTQIDGVRNEGAGGRNWTYAVNGERADRSFAIYQLKPGDEVLWNFAAQR